MALRRSSQRITTTFLLLTELRVSRRRSGRCRTGRPSKGRRHAPTRTGCSRDNPTIAPCRPSRCRRRRRRRRNRRRVSRCRVRRHVPSQVRQWPTKLSTRRRRNPDRRWGTHLTRSRPSRQLKLSKQRQAHRRIRLFSSRQSIPGGANARPQAIVESIGRKVYTASGRCRVRGTIGGRDSGQHGRL